VLIFFDNTSPSSRMIKLLFIAMLAAAQSANGEATVTKLDGQTISGAVADWSATTLTIATSAGERIELPVEQLTELRLPQDVSETPQATHLVLTDGTRLVCEQFSLESGQANVRASASSRPIRIPRQAIRLVELRAPTPLITATLAEIAEKGQPGDALVVSQAGSESMDYLTGVIGDVTADQVSFKWDGQPIPVKRTKIAAMTFYQQPNEAKPDSLCRLELADGSQIAAATVSLRDRVLEISTPTGVEFQIDVDRLVRADFSSGKIVYLSDLKPEDVAWTPAFGLPQSDSITARHLPRFDASFSGEPLALLWKNDVARSRRDVRTYSKGLAIRSRTELTYRLPEGMSRFTATAGIDPKDAAQGHVLLTIRGDDRVLWEGVVDGKSPPVELDVQLGTARRLLLTVDYGGGLDYGDRLHLVEARVTK
jgi:hypothetical protein